ncbi:MAG: hypothetical protein KUG73_08270 [Pseudomonadales bacterium]|nr:hypothetical protein [Pseudomonadales bacterium]
MPLTTKKTRPSSTWLRLLLAFVMYSFVLSPFYCFADGVSADRFKLNGFLTLGAVKSGTKNLGYRRDISGDGVYDSDWSLKPDTRLGLQGSVGFTEKLNATIQLIMKDRTVNGAEESVESAYLRYRLLPQVTTRVGRIGFQLFMLSDYRDLGFAYIWARPPIEFYAPIAFDYFDGADISYSLPLGAGMLRTTLFVGESDAPLDYDDGNDKLRLNNMFGFSGSWELEYWQARFTIVSVEIDDDFDETLGIKTFTDALSTAAPLWADAASLSEQLSDTEDGVIYYSIGISYDKNPWFVQSEVVFLDSAHNVLKSYLGRYISIGFRARETTLYAIIAKGNQTETRESIPALPAPLVSTFETLQQGLQSFYDYNYIDQKTASIGVRWDIRYDLALKTQWDRTWVDKSGGLLWHQKIGSSEDEIVDTYSINLNYIF